MSDETDHPPAGRVPRVRHRVELWRAPVDRVVIGRDVAADLRLDDPRISREHVVVDRDATGSWTVRDRLSRNGTFRGGRAVGTLRLRASTLLRLGHPDEGIEVELLIDPVDAGPLPQPGAGVRHWTSDGIEQVTMPMPRSAPAAPRGPAPADPVTRPAAGPAAQGTSEGSDQDGPVAAGPVDERRRGRVGRQRGRHRAG